MSNASYVCFDCRAAVRRSTPERAVVKCPSCGQRCQYLGRKIPVPPKSKVAAWRDLRASMATVRSNWAIRQERTAVRRRHDVEKQIVELEARPASPSRDRLLADLRRELARG
jgi:DNA-directed RNA polymerase subunit RPC12/RpoP